MLIQEAGYKSSISTDKNHLSSSKEISKDSNNTQPRKERQKIKLTLWNDCSLYSLTSRVEITVSGISITIYDNKEENNNKDDTKRSQIFIL